MGEEDSWVCRVAVENAVSFILWSSNSVVCSIAKLVGFGSRPEQRHLFDKRYRSVVCTCDIHVSKRILDYSLL